MKKKLFALILAVALVASFFAIPAQALGAKDFSDVPEESWFYADVDYVAEYGYMNGYPDGTFLPDGLLTREELATVLARFGGADISNTDVTPYDDIQAGRWSAGAIQWMKDTGLTTGTGDNKFSPEEKLTRQELATFVDRFVQYYLSEHTDVAIDPKPVYPEFNDMDQAADWAKDHINADRENGLLYGYPDGGFHPLDNTTRAQIAAIFHRLSVELMMVDDPIGKAVRSAVDTANNGLIKRVNENGSQLGGRATVTVEEMRKNTLGIERGTTSALTLNIKGEIGEDLIEKAFEVATTMAIRVVNGERDIAVDEVTDYLSELLAAFEAETGLNVTKANLKELANKITDNIRATNLYAQAKAKALEQKDKYRELFLEDGVYVAGGATITVNGESVQIKVVDNKAGVVGSKKEAVKKLGVALLKDFYQELKANTTYTDLVKTSAVINIKFEDNEEAPSIKARSERFTLDYSLTINLEGNSNGVLEYKYAGGNYFLLNIPHETLEDYGEKLCSLLDDIAQQGFDQLDAKLMEELGGSRNFVNACYAQITDPEAEQVGTATPANLEERINDMIEWAQKPPINSTVTYRVAEKVAGLPEVVKNYIYACVCDMLNERCGFESLDPATNYAEGIRDTVKTGTLNDLVSMALSEEARSRIGDKGFNVIKRVQDLADYLPSSAVLTINGETLTKADLEGLINATSTLGAIEALRDLLAAKPGLGTLALGAIDEGSELAITAEVGGFGPHTIHIGVHFE